MKNKKIWIIICIALILLALIIGCIVVIKNSDNKGNVDIYGSTNTVTKPQQVKVTGKLAEYIKGLADNYYIKYSGKFKNNEGSFVDCIVEYTKNGNNFAIKSSNLDMHIICEEQKLYSISHNYKIIVQMGVNSFDVSEFNLASDIGQSFVKEYSEKVNNTKYDVEEYSYNGQSLKYYFKDADLELIRYNGQDIKIIRLEHKTNSGLLVRPTNYTYAIA